MESALEELQKTLGPGAVKQAHGYLAVTLHDERGARDLAAWAAERRWRLHPWNGGAPPTALIPSPTLLVSPGPALAGGFSFAFADAYAEVPATATMAELGARLAAERYCFPFAAAAAAAMTAGELLSRNPRNAFAPIYGELQRLLLGLWFVNDEGDVVHVGRRTVKGVAGYELAKLFLGSRGKMGLITRVRFRLFPRPRGAALWTTTKKDIPAGFNPPICAVRKKGETLAYAEGHASLLENALARLSGRGKKPQPVARDAAATATFAAAADGHFATPAREPAETPPLTALFV